MHPWTIRAACATALALAAFSSSAQTPATGTTSAATTTSGVTTPAPQPQPQPPQRCSRPAYPADALRNEDTGVVMLEFLIGTDGAVRDTRILKSSGHANLDEAARVGLAKCQFTPSMLNGAPVEQWIKVQYVWTLS